MIPISRERLTELGFNPDDLLAGLRVTCNPVKFRRGDDLVERDEYGSILIRFDYFAPVYSRSEIPESREQQKTMLGIIK
jgi:hypothetical protein